LLDLWDNKQECEASTDAKAVAELQKLPVQKGESQCIHLRDQDGGRICIVHVVLGSLLVENKEVSQCHTSGAFKQFLPHEQSCPWAGFFAIHSRKPHAKMWHNT
jgi:hypothetical protein